MSEVSVGVGQVGQVGEVWTTELHTLDKFIQMNPDCWFSCWVSDSDQFIS